MMIVLQFGISRPLSMMVVQTSSWYLPGHEIGHHQLKLVGVHLAVADADAEPGSSSRSRAATRSMVMTRLCR
jgi:hypothetical protein